MIDFLKPIERFVATQGKKELQKYLLIYLGSILVIASILIYWQTSSAISLNKKILAINVQRAKAQEVLSRAEEVASQKSIVDKALKDGQKIKLQHYFELTINKLKLQNHLKKNETFISHLENLRTQGYSEVRVEASLINLNTKQLVELLDEIERNTIIYIKYLEITKSGKAPAIDVLMTIATLQLDNDLTAG
jgi:hypothetical protein